jgi:multicomponent Na+:H+ antiporter subunit G
MSFALDILTIAAVSAGAFFFLAGTVGLLRFPDSLTRLHALTKADNLGLGLVVIGLLPQVGSLRGGLKLVCVWLLVLLAGSAVSQLIASATLANEAGARRGDSVVRRHGTSDDAHGRSADTRPESGSPARVAHNDGLTP